MRYDHNKQSYVSPSEEFDLELIATKDGKPVSLQNPFPVTTVGSAIGVNTFNASTAVDAFGRLRVSNPHTLFDSTLRFGDDSRQWSMSNSLGGISSNLINESSVAMTLDTTSGSSVKRQTKHYFQYQPGKSLLFLNTFVMGSGKANVRQRVGNFDTKNGIFLEQLETTTYIVKRSFISGVAEDTAIPQSQWNVDTLDGSKNSNNPSGIELDISKAQIQWADVEWLGVGSVRVGFVINGQFVLCHVFHHANIETSAYMTSATLPVRYEIENIGISTSNTTLKHICNSVISEGGYHPSVLTRAVSTDLGGLPISDTQYTPLLSIRLKDGYEGAIVLPLFVDLYGLQTTAFNYKIVNDSNVSGGQWLSAGDESSVEYNSNANVTISEGRNLQQGMFNGGTYNQPVRIDLKNTDHQYQLKSKIDGSKEVFSILVKATTNNDDALGSLTWSEFN
jgi:hypothetical protein